MPELRVEAREGVALVVSTEPQPLLPPVTVEAAAVEIYVRYADEPVGTEQHLGTVQPGGTLVREYNPDRDRDLIIAKISRSIEGVPDVGQMLDAESVKLTINRIPDAPELSQGADATNTLVLANLEAGRFARIVRVEVSDNADMSDAVVDDYPVVNNKVPDVLKLEREAAAPTLTKYVRVSILAGQGFGDPSGILEVTFADESGDGGTGGTGLPPGGHVIVPVLNP